MSTDNEQLARDFFAAIYAGDAPALLGMLSDDAEWWLTGQLPQSGRYVGKDAILNDLLAPFGAVWEDNKQTYELHTVLAAGDHVVVELSSRGTTAHGSAYHGLYCYVLRMADGAIERVRAYVDTGYALGVLFGAQREFPSFD